MARVGKAMAISVKVDDEVVVAGRNGKRSHRGRVSQVARVWITVQNITEGERWPTEWRFRLDDQTDGLDSFYGYRFYTLEQWERREQLGAAMTFLRERGIDIRVSHDRKWTPERRIRLAEMIRAEWPE